MKRLDIVDGLSAILTHHKHLSVEDMMALQRDYKNRDHVTFEDFLLEESLIDREDLLQALSEYHGVPYLDVVGTFFDHQFIRLLPKEMLLKHLILPYYREEGEDALWVVSADPSNPHIREVLGNYVTHSINFMVGLPQDIRDAIREYYDRSNTYQPHPIANQLMERSMQSVHTVEELDPRIPEIIQETIDDYESK